MKQHQNIKNSTFVETSADKQIFKLNNIIFHIIHILGFGGIIAFLFLNLIYSQFISPLYQKFVNNDKISTINFLQKIKNFPEFQKILEMNNGIYGPVIKKEIFAKENIKKEMINNLEQQLTFNPKARDVLYGLYQLYLQEGNENQADDYLRQAKAIDPLLK